MAVYSESYLKNLVATKKAIKGRDYVQQTGPEKGTLYRGNGQGTLDFITNNFAILAQNAVGEILVSTDSNTTTYNPSVPEISTELKDTGVVAGTYGDASNVPQIELGEDGRVISAVNVPISVPAVETQYAPILMLGGM